MEKNPEIKGKPDPLEKRPRETSDKTTRALGKAAIDGANRGKR
ncbi:hypothetical protein AB0E63_42730 [Kribbella sp. NPDC026596]